MATTKPRLMLSLSPATHATVRRLAAVQQRPVASVAAEYLEMAAPVLERVAAALEAVAAQAAAARDEQSAAFHALAGDVEAAQPVLLGLLEKLSAAANARPEGPQPPVCNHGGQIGLHPLQLPSLGGVE